MKSFTASSNLHVALYQPEIAPNTGNIIRLCANTGAKLHLVHPLGFDWEHKKLRRAGLDYHELVEVVHHQDCNAFIAQCQPQQRILACTTKSKHRYTEVTYQSGDVLLFGPETRGLPLEVREKYETIRIPMRPHSRSINLANAVSIVLFEAWRQLDFMDGE